jgi:hypothetical protein
MHNQQESYTAQPERQLHDTARTTVTMHNKQESYAAQPEQQ